MTPSGESDVKREKARARAWAQRRAETCQRVSAEQREFEAGFDAGWWKRGLGSEALAEAEVLIRELLDNAHDQRISLRAGTRARHFLDRNARERHVA